MQNVSKFPVAIDTTDDQITLTYSDGSVEQLGRLSGYPGSEMTSMDVDAYGTLSWSDPLGVKTEVGTLAKNINLGYSGANSGVFKEYGTIDSVLTELLAVNSTLPESGDLIRSFTLDNPDNQPVLYQGSRGMSLTGVGTLVASSFTSASYPIFNIAKYVRDPGTSDCFLYAGSDPLKETVWTFDQPTSFSGVELLKTASNFLDKLPDYFAIYCSPDGETWKRILKVYDYQIGGYIPFDKVVLTKYLKIKSFGGGTADVLPCTNFIVSKSKIKLPLTIDTDWVNPDTTKVTETEDSFILSPLFDNVPDLDNFLAVSKDPVLHMSNLIPAGTTDYTTDSNRILKFDNVISCSLSANYRNGGFKLPAGRYRAELDIYNGDGSPKVDVSLKHSKSSVKIARAEYADSSNREENEPMGTYHLEFTISTDDYVYFSVERSIDDYSEELVSDVVEYLRIFAIPDHSLTRQYLPFFKYVNHLETLAETDVTLSNLDYSTFFRGSEYSTIIKGSSYGNVYSEVTFPTPAEIVAYTLISSYNNTKLFGDYEIQALVGDEWITAYKASQKDDLLAGIVHSVEFEQPITAKKWRIFWEPTGSTDANGSMRLLRFALHTSEQRFNSPARCEAITTEGIYRSSAIDFVMYPVELLSIASNPITIRVDEPCNIRLDLHYSNVSYISRTVHLTNVFTDDTVSAEHVAAENDEYPVTFSQVQPGVYTISAPSTFPLAAIYLEKV